MAMGCNFCVTAFLASDPPEKNPMFGTCGHLFHLNCIQKALSNNLVFCPVCGTIGRDAIDSYVRLHMSSINNGNSSFLVPDRRLSTDASEDEELRALDRELRKIRCDISIEEDRIRKINSFIKEISKSVQHINIEMTENVIDLCDSIYEPGGADARLSIAAGFTPAASSSTGRNSPSYLPRPSFLFPSTSTATTSAAPKFKRPADPERK